MTLTEKLLARAAGKSHVSAGDNIWVNADVLMTHDVCGPGTIGVFKREFGQNAKVWDRNRVVIIPDHYIFTSDSKSNRNVDILRDFDPETIVEMAIVAPVSAEADEITVDQFEVEGVMLRDPADSDGEQVVWLIGGDSNDVEEFIDAMESVAGEVQTNHHAEVIDLERAHTARR